MSRVVFILGAGASKQAGAPLMNDFLEVASNLLRLGEIKDKEEAFNRVFRAISGLQKVHSKAHLDLYNIESIFTALELGRVIQRVPGLETFEIPLAIASLKELIVRTLERTVFFPVSGNRLRAPAPYDSFAQLLEKLTNQAHPREDVSVITFNYDTAIDVAIAGIRRPIDYNLDAQASQRQGAIPVLKLHGSLNWGELEDPKVDEQGPGGSRIVACDLSSHVSTSHYYEDGSCQLSLDTQRAFPVKVKAEPVIVPPSWNKADYHQALSHVWAAAARHLSEAENIFIIGYSLPETDSFFRNLYALGSEGQSTLKRVVVFNPDETGAVESRFRSLLGSGALPRFRYEPCTFAEAIPTIERMFTFKVRL